MTRASVLSLYRELLKLIGRLPANAQRSDALQQARSEMRQHVDACPEKVADQLRILVSKIGYLRMITPKRATDTNRVGVGTFVVRGGEVTQGTGESAGDRVANGSISQDEAWRLHRKLMKRQYFGREPPRIPEIF